jgi:glycosyltransferase involved in cell wall biosynthesis
MPEVPGQKQTTRFSQTLYKMKQTIFFISDYWLPKIGGMERSIQYLSQPLLGDFIINLLTCGPQFSQNHLCGMNITKFKNPNGQTYYPDVYEYLASRETPCICHFFGFSFKWPRQQADLIRNIKRHQGYPVVFKIPASGDVSRYLDEEFLHCKNEIDCFVTLNNTIKNELLCRGIEESKIFTVSNCAPTQFFRPPTAREKNQARRKFNLPENVFLLGFCGRFIKRKRVDVLINAVNSLSGERRPHLLLIGYDDPAFGDGFSVRNYLSRYIHHIPAQYDMRPVFHAMDAYITASEAEGMSNALLEAISSGLPVLGNSIDGHKEMIVNGKNGFLFSNNDISTVVNCIQKLHHLYKEDRLTPYSECSRIMAETRYDSKIISSKYRYLYLELSRSL